MWGYRKGREDEGWDDVRGEREPYVFLGSRDNVLPEGVSVSPPAAASAASSWALHSCSSWDNWVFFSVRSCMSNDP